MIVSEKLVGFLPFATVISKLSAKYCLVLSRAVTVIELNG